MSRPTRSMPRTRAFLAAVGVGLMCVGVFFAATTWAPIDVVDVTVWLIAAVVIHDAILAPAVVLVGVVGHGAAARIGPLAAGVARAAFVTASCCAIVVVPGLVVRATGPRNPTIHPVDYLVVLAVVWAGAVVIGATSLAWGWRRRAGARRRA